MNHRELKFRAWDTKTSKMIFTGFHIMGEVTAFGGIEDHISENMCGAATTLERWNDIIITQWTGIKDKNGNDIYEGDIVNFIKPGFDHGPTKEKIENAEVWWSADDLSFLFGKYQTYEGFPWGYQYFDEVRDNTLEVVGNIFEKK